MQRLERLTWEIDIWEESPAKRKLSAKLEEAYTYFNRNQAYIVNYEDRYRHDDTIASSFVESAVNQVVSKRFAKKQQMAWSDRNAHDLLQVRTAVLNDELKEQFETWYPSMAANEGTLKMAA